MTSMLCKREVDPVGRANVRNELSTASAQKDKWGHTSAERNMEWLHVRSTGSKYSGKACKGHELRRQRHVRREGSLPAIVAQSIPVALHWVWKTS